MVKMKYLQINLFSCLKIKKIGNVYETVVSKAQDIDNKFE